MHITTSRNMDQHGTGWQDRRGVIRNECEIEGADQEGSPAYSLLASGTRPMLHPPLEYEGTHTD